MQQQPKQQSKKNLSILLNNIHGSKQDNYEIKELQKIGDIQVFDNLQQTDYENGYYEPKGFIKHQKSTIIYQGNKANEKGDDFEEEKQTENQAADSAQKDSYVTRKEFDEKVQVVKKELKNEIQEKFDELSTKIDQILSFLQLNNKASPQKKEEQQPNKKDDKSADTQSIKLLPAKKQKSSFNIKPWIVKIMEKLRKNPEYLKQQIQRCLAKENALPISTNSMPVSKYAMPISKLVMPISKNSMPISKNNANIQK